MREYEIERRENKEEDRDREKIERMKKDANLESGLRENRRNENERL